MKSLSQHQAGVRDLIKGRADLKPDDPYLAMVAESSGLAMIREIAIWWRAFQLENYCVWTSKLLKRLGLFDRCVRTFFCGRAVSPFIEKAGEEFLGDLSDHEDPLVAAVAAFEWALVKAKMGDTRKYQIGWDRNPEEVFRSLISNCDLPPVELNCRYETHVSRDTQDFVRCIRLAAHPRESSSPRVPGRPEMSLSAADESSDLRESEFGRD